jgi:hypothetical protein
MLREPQHERTILNDIKTPPVRPEPVEGLPESFSTACRDLTLAPPLSRLSAGEKERDRESL